MKLVSERSSLILRILSYLFAALILCLSCQQCFSQKTIVVRNVSERYDVGKNMQLLIDTAKVWDHLNILQARDFKGSEADVPVYPVSKNTYWVKFSVKNLTSASTLFLDLQYSNISFLKLYKVKNDQLVLLDTTGNAYRFNTRGYNDNNFIIDLRLPPLDSGTYILRINNKHPLLLPLSIAAESGLMQIINFEHLTIGAYIGVLLAIFFYNLFIFFFVKDNNYLVYIIYLLFLCLAQMSVSGYAFKYFWPTLPFLNNYAVVLFTAMAFITTIIFAKKFLQTAIFIPRTNKALTVIIMIFVAAIVLNFIQLDSISYELLNYGALLTAVLLIVGSLSVAKNGFRSAYYYMIAWASVLIGLIIIAFRNLGILPYNYFTTYVLYIGTSIEAILLSIALADRINVYKREKEESQAAALSISRENERIILEQNIVLEEKVKLRTEELENSNKSLNIALQDLKNAESQLVETEKMASIGQLTAGIAHEINNPINFVKSNVRPLQMDINDLLEVIRKYEEINGEDHTNVAAKLKEIEGFKQQIDLDYINSEIQTLLKGIEEGAVRTAEIVKGLQIFSRLDESELKLANVHDGIDSTLILLRNALSDIVVEKHFGDLPPVECFPGKLNQVFMNILNNAIYAIRKKDEPGTGKITIITSIDDERQQITISIADTGIGMLAKVREKIFEPFFTTKDVGEGTGLGLSIVFSIIEKHGGKIIVNTEYGKGSEFIISLPVTQATAS